MRAETNVKGQLKYFHVMCGISSLLITSIFILQEIEVANIIHPSNEKISILKTKPELVLYDLCL